MTSKLLTEDQVIELLRSIQGDRTMKDVALEMGVSLSYLSDVLLRHRAPGKLILERLGLIREVRYMRTNNHKDKSQ